MSAAGTGGGLPLIQGDGVVLRPYRLEDAEAVARGCADPVTQRFVPNLPHLSELVAHWR